MEKEKKIKAPKAIWDSATHTIYMDACVEEARASNRGGTTLTDLGKVNLVRKFNEVSGINYSSDQVKNRWDICRAEYSVWKTLTQKASGIGRDEYMKTIAALDGWWALEIKANPVATKFRYAPLLEEEKTRKVFDACCVTNEHARVSIPTYKSGSSRFNMGDDSGCESHDVEGTPRPKRAKSGKKMPCSYSSSPRMNEKWSNEIVKTDALVRTVGLFGAREKIKGNSREDTIRKEIEDMMDMVIEDCAKPGSDVHFYASHIML